MPNIIFIAPIVRADVLPYPHPLPMEEGKHFADEPVCMVDGTQKKARDIETEFKEKFTGTIQSRVTGALFHYATSAKLFADIKGTDYTIGVCAKFGNSDDGVTAKRLFEENGIEVIDARQDTDASLSDIFLMSGQDGRFVRLGKPMQGLDGDFETRLRTAIQNADIVHVHNLCEDISIMAARIAREERKDCIVDVANGSPNLDQIMVNATHAFFPDECRFEGKLVGAEGLLEYILSFENIRHAGVVRGEKSTIYYNRDTGIKQFIPVSTGTHFRVIDKPGAGDVMRAGLLVEMLDAKKNDAPIDMAAFIQKGMTDATFSIAFQGRKWQEFYTPEQIRLVTGMGNSDQQPAFNA